MTTSRYELTGRLRFTSAYHSRGTQHEAGYDAPLLRDGSGRLIVAGRSLAGVLRAWATTVLDDDAITDVFGGIDAGASRVTIDDVVLTNADVSLRDGVAIDRYSGSAADRMKFDRWVVLPGAGGDFRLVCDLPTDDEYSRRVLDECARALKAGDLSVGGLVSRGHGSIVLDEPKLTKFSGRRGVLSRLDSTRAGETVGIDEASAARSPELRPLRLMVGLSQRGPVYAQDRRPHAVMDSLPLVERVKDTARLIIPATGVKGVLRSECERIVRTISGEASNPGASEPFRERDFLDQIDVDIVRELFGTAAGKPTAARGLIRVGDLRSATIGPWAEWERVVSFDPTEADEPEETKKLRQAGEFRAALSNSPFKAWRAADHVAIDRWTGGASDGLLFNNLEPYGVVWDSLELRIQRTETGNAPRLALLLMALQSLHAGRIGFGFGFNRGYGRMAVTFLTVEGGEGFGIADGDYKVNGSSLYDALEGRADGAKAEWVEWCTSMSPGGQR